MKKPPDLVTLKKQQLLDLLPPTLRPLVPGTRVVALLCTGAVRGKVVGRATVFPVKMPDGGLKSCKNPEVRPNPHALPPSASQLCLEGELKIKLDAPVEGREYVYGHEACIIPEPVKAEAQVDDGH